MKASDESEGPLGTKEVARILNISERTVVRLFRAGKIAAVQIQGTGRPKLWRATREELRRYLKGLYDARRDAI